MNAKIFLLASSLLLAAPTFAVVLPGDSYDAVIAEKGLPLSKVERGKTLVLTYPDAVIRVTEGKVESVKAVAPDYAVHAEKATPPSARSTRAASTGEWLTDFSDAKAQAKASGRKLFVLFTGSDWCVWCKRLESEILSQSSFQEYARENLVLVKLDFPRNIQQSPAVQHQNKELMMEYRIQGYPTIVVLGSDGAKLGELGYVKGGPRVFLSQLRQL